MVDYTRQGFWMNFLISDKENSMAYKYKTLPLQNYKCLECQFCLWYEEYGAYRCGIRGCYNNSSFVKFEIKNRKIPGDTPCFN